MRVVHLFVKQVLLVHHLVAVATTRRVPDKHEEASHLCNHTACKSLGHVIWESAMKNQQRKGCQVWVECPHDCGKVIIICPHEPKCIKTIPDVEEADYLADPNAYAHV